MPDPTIYEFQVPKDCRSVMLFPDLETMKKFAALENENITIECGSDSDSQSELPGVYMAFRRADKN